MAIESLEATGPRQLGLFKAGARPALNGDSTPFPDFVNSVFPRDVEIIPQLNEVYELQLAFGEVSCLDDAALQTRGAYFARVNGSYTNHFRLCTGTPLVTSPRASTRLRSFFKSNQFKTGYGTHGFFPYRGKFHPQMIKALINVIGLEPGMTVLDPMGGSGTVAIEAATMGIRAISYDISPFCTLMTQAKYEGLLLREDELSCLIKDVQGLRNDCERGELSPIPARVRNVVLLAYLDSRGYELRTKGRPGRNLFHDVLVKYARAVAKFALARDQMELAIGESQIETCDARFLPLGDESIDGVIFSPPYSFAVDYIENDLQHLEYLGHQSASLREHMIGLRGGRLKNRVNLYFEDMKQVLRECARVLRPGRYCTVVVGSNTNQLRSVLRTDDPNETSIEFHLETMAAHLGLETVKRMSRQITGLMNVMRDESILFLRKH